MKIFGYEFRKFEQKNTTINAIETWCVKWLSMRADPLGEHRYSPRMDWEVQAFPEKESAELFAKELRDAMRLLGHKGFSVSVYKQATPTNKN